eukprot:scaffold11828_cov61-Attheya_sp.AAC.2
MVLRPGGGGGDGERRCIGIVEGERPSWILSAYQFCTAAHVEAATAPILLLADIEVKLHD